MNDEPNHKHRKYYILALFAVFIAILGVILPEQEDIAFEIVKNNTDLCDFNHTSMTCNGTRQDNITYYTNDTPIVLYVFTHADTTGQNAGIFLYRDDVLIEAQVGRPLASPENTWRGITAIIPKNSSYRANFTNYHHFEWYEDQILSGRNGTLSINQYFNTTTTGGSGVSFDGSVVDLNGSSLKNGSQEYGTFNHSNLTNLDFYNSSHTGFAAATASKTITVGASGKDYTTVFDAYSSIEPVIEGDITILIDAGTYATPINTGGKTSKNGYVINFVGNNSTTLVSTTGTGGTAGSAATQATVVKAGAGWTVDAYQGKWLIFTSGNNAGIERLIENNTADTLNLVGNYLSNAPLNGEGFNIIENNVNITGDIHMYPSGVKHIFRNVNLKEFSGTQVSVEFYNSQIEPGSYLNNNFFVSNVIFDRTYIKTQTTGNLYGYYMISIYSEIRNGSYAYGNFSASSSLGWSALVYSGHVLVRDGSLIKNYWAGLWSRLGGSALIWKGDLTNAASIHFHNNSIALKADQAGFIQVDDAVFSGSTAADKSPAGATDPGWIS